MVLNKSLPSYIADYLEYNPAAKLDDGTCATLVGNDATSDDGSYATLRTEPDTSAPVPKLTTGMCEWLRILHDLLFYTSGTCAML